MKLFLATLFLAAELFASLDSMTTFDADFTQSITDEENKTIHYNGHIVASKPQNARWSYFKPIKKEVYINDFEATIVEPEIEQVIVRQIESNFDFFKIIGKAKKNSQNSYTA
ncbi:MAG: LolA-like outer membrane lipoprotein chaperone, partial [Sulfurimonas sp.]|nr:LolA-like outer membrane lipoprotein chaperone [Sulfurimonas sp.]